ncbi:hypothetical protein FJQ98_16865 [Lysinibacillus agricola]|uniref:LamG-like jellyroll fold domain-containing protein n=1 Tax=Lysinibacillus agricola TaxID=2590012 RepID=A0ABX7AM89_9BACI|nr:MULTISPECIES: LamG-like jellyroll fold domain-containing protein [Lysinibacillus]KOS61406.1 hypothetical protein AN161_17565 [Lysinibacillus sp. FJAT-14222]QQP10915.1 hypothetical protein FJQ98_16865 [Lysinibacillus agricola]
MATTEQLMAQYGVAWFGFDEPSGNTYDKLGNGYVGEMINIQRPEGWNGSGHSALFNGTSSVMTQTTGKNALMPSTEVAIRLKFKCDVVRATDMYLLSTLSSYTTQKGMSIGIINNGKIHVGWTNAGNKFCFFYNSPDNFNDGKWHDMFLSWDGKINSLVHIFIDDMTKPIVVLRSQFANDGHTYPNFNLGRSAGATTRWYAGQIDDLQIYNKALSPSDFTQKRLAIKTADNKNITLPSTMNRIKEIPNIEENTLLTQGRIIKEIDSATDRLPVDLTKATTEYELVSNTQAALNSNKVFTIPLSTDFKTINIEDNY